MAKTDEKLQLPSMLSFERKLETSDALMYSGNWSDLPAFEAELIDDEEEKQQKIKERQEIQKKAWQAIKITPRFNRATISAHSKKADDIDKTKPNPVSSGNDDATLLPENDTLKVSFTLRVIGNLGMPYACNDFSFEKAITERVKQFKDEDGAGLKTLAFRYAYNIANGRFLWRNRVCADDITVHVFNGEGKQPIEFKPYDYSLKNFDKNKDYENLKTLADMIQTGLQGEHDFVFFKVVAYVKLGLNQHVFPSEEMNMNEKGKTLFKLNECAAMHNVKIGNAIRTIDDWYDNNVLIKYINEKNKEATKTVQISHEERRPIAIEPYGSVTQRGCAYRSEAQDLYTLMVNWANNNELQNDEKNYVVANMIRGGVFSRAK